MQKSNPGEIVRNRQRQNRPGIVSKMKPITVSADFSQISSREFKGKTAVITGWDSGMVRAVAMLFAKEDAGIVTVYPNEPAVANQTKEIIVVKYYKKYFLITRDISKESFCNNANLKIQGA